MADRGDNHGALTHRSGEERTFGHTGDAEAERRRYEQSLAEMNAGGLSDADRAAAERRLTAQPGSIAARLDGNAPEHEVDTPAEVSKFTTAVQDSPEAAVTKGSSGESQHQDRVRWPERDPDLEVD